MDFESYVKSLGFDPSALTAEQSAGLESAWRAANKPKENFSTDKQPSVNLPRGKAEIDAITAEVQAEEDRKAGIAKVFREFVQKRPDRLKDFEAAARKAEATKSTTPKDLEHELLKASYIDGPLAFSPSRPQVSDKVLEVAVARAIGISRETIEKSFDDATLSAADKHFRGGCGLKRLVTMCARANGLRDAQESDFAGVNSTKRILKAAFREEGEASLDGFATAGFGPSSYNLSGILSNVMNKSIRDYFNAIENVWRMITAVRPVNDFKQISGYSLTGDLQYKKVAPGGEVKHGTLGETEYTNRADLYAIMLGIDYQHLRNDDLGAFDAINRRLGRGAGLTINEVFWTEFLATSPAFWSTANSNYVAGTDYAFTLDKLENADVAWGLRTDPDGKPMGDRARYLLVSNKWKLKARRYMGSTMISEDGGEGANNVLAGMWEPISSIYLSDSTITGSSADNYYLLGDPADMPAIETVFLDGQEVPTIETAEPDLSRLGIMVRGMHGFGVSRQEPRGGYKFKQTAD